MTKSTFDRIMVDAKRKKQFDEGYHEFLLDEMILAMTEGDHKSVRKLAEETGISPRIIQELKSGQQKDMRLSNFFNLLAALGYKIFFKKGRHQLALENFKVA